MPTNFSGVAAQPATPELPKPLKSSLPSGTDSSQAPSTTSKAKESSDSKELKKSDDKNINPPLKDEPSSDLRRVLFYSFLLLTSAISLIFLLLNYLLIRKQNSTLDRIEKSLTENTKDIKKIQPLINNIDKESFSSTNPQAPVAQFAQPEDNFKDTQTQTSTEPRNKVTSNVSVQQPILSYDPDNIISVYNYDASLLRKDILAFISESTESIEARMLDNSLPLVLQKVNNKGDYWVIKWQQENYMLVPKTNFRFNEFSYETLRCIFELQNYYSGFNKFKLIQPAYVLPQQGGNQWRVERYGILQFTQ